MRPLRFALISLFLFGALRLVTQSTAVTTRHFLEVAWPGLSNCVEYGGVGILVYDVEAGYRFVKRIPTWDVRAGQEAENVKGVVANARTARIYVSTPKRIAAFDLLSERKVWDREFAGGCDRLAISPDGQTLYVPSFEGPHWLVVNAATGDVLKTIVLNSGAHNTIYSPDGRRAYLAGLKSPLLRVTATNTHEVAKEIGPFSNVIRPFTINGAGTLCYVNVNELLGFEIGDLTTGKKLQRVEVQGVAKGPVKRHSCPAHGIGLTPDEKEIRLCDGRNQMLHVFDNTVMPPKQMQSIKLRDQPGWITFSLDGRYAWPSTGEIIDPKTKRIINTFSAEPGPPLQNAKNLQLH